MADENKTLEETKKLQQEVIDQIDEIENKRKDNLQYLESELKSYEDMKTKIRDQISLLLDKRKMNEGNKEQLKEQISLLREQEKQLEENIKDLGEINKVLEGHGKTISLTIGTLTGVTDQWKKTFIGSFIQAAGEVGSLNLVMEASIKQFKEQFSLSNILGSGLMKMQESTLALAYAQDQAISSFLKSTGAASNYQQIIVDLERSNLRFGMSNQDVANSLQALYTEVNTFTSFSREQQAEITETVAQLEKLGISAQTSAKNISIATRALGMSVGESERLTRELYTAATALQLPPDMVAEGFAKAAPQLAAHGDKMVDVFKGLAKQSKETGVAIDSLLAITKQFDTFEGAAQATGKLNTLLGGDYLNSVELLTASEEDRIKLMQEAIDMSDVQWHEMNKFQKMAVANAVGITDMAEAAMLFNPQMIGMSEADRKTAVSKKELADRMKEVLPLADQMKSIMAAFAVSMRPVVERLKTVADFILMLNDATGGALIPTIVAMIGFIKLLSVGISTATPIVALFGKTADSAGKSAGKGLAVGIRQVGAAAARAGVGLLKFGAAVMMVGAGIGIAALGMAQFVKAFQGMDPTQILAVSAAIAAFGAVMIGTVLTLAAAGPAALIAVPIMLAFAGALYMAAEAMKSFNGSLANVTDAVVERYRAIGVEIRGIVEAVNELSLAKAVPFTVITAAVTSPEFKTASPASERIAVNAAQTIDSAKRTSAIAATTAARQTAPTGGGEPKVQVVPAKIIIDGKVFGEIVTPITEKKAGEVLERYTGRMPRVAGRAEFEIP